MQTKNNNTAVAEIKSDANLRWIGYIMQPRRSRAGIRQCVKVEAQYSGIYDHPSLAESCPQYLRKGGMMADVRLVFDKAEGELIISTEDESKWNDLFIRFFDKDKKHNWTTTLNRENQIEIIKKTSGEFVKLNRRNVIRKERENEYIKQLIK